MRGRLHNKIWCSMVELFNSIFFKKITGSIYTGKNATILACAATCTAGTANGITTTCCQTDNCNEDTTLASSSTTVSSCNVGGSFSLIDPASSTYSPALCPSASNSYCLVGFIFLFFSKIKKK